MSEWINTEALVKYYSKNRALDMVTLRLNATSVSLVGPNGAGKSTLMSILEGLTHYSGDVQVLGMSPDTDSVKICKKIGFAPERPSFYQAASPRDIFKRVHDLKGVEFSEINRITERFGFSQLIKRSIYTLSLGEQQILTIITALLWAEEGVILDEPNANLDIWRQSEFMEILQEELKSRGLKFLISTHLIDKTIPHTEHVILLDKGKVLYSGPTSELQSLYEKNRYYIWCTDTREITKYLDTQEIRLEELNGKLVKIESHLSIGNILDLIPVERQKSILKVERTPIEEIIRGYIENKGVV